MELSHDMTVLGDASRFRGVCSLSAEMRPWLEQFPRNAVLDQREILHVGLAHVMRPYRIVRCRQTTLFFLATVGGEGRVFVEGGWRKLKEGTGCLLPPHLFHAFHAVGRLPWKFAWVCCPPRHVLVSAATPVVASFDSHPLWSAIEGMTAEAAAGARPRLMMSWAQLVEGYLSHFASPMPQNDPFIRVWDLVNQQLSAAWSLERLAREARCGAERLRRQCLQHFNRSPMHQVMYLRMRRAAELLAGTTEKIETVAAAVGYQNPFVFSSTFKKWMGCTPSAYRTGAAGKTAAPPASETQGQR